MTSLTHHSDDQLIRTIDLVDEDDLHNLPLSQTLWVVPDWDDILYAGRSLEVSLSEPRNLDEAADELDLLSKRISDIRDIELLLLRSDQKRIRLVLEHCVVLIDFLVSSEMATLLLRYAARHLRWAGVSALGDWIVVSDPHETCAEFREVPQKPRLTEAALTELAPHACDVADPSSLFGLPLDRAIEGWGWSWLEAAVFAGHVPHFEGIELVVRATFEAYALQIEEYLNGDADGDADAWRGDCIEVFSRLAALATELAHKAEDIEVLPRRSRSILRAGAGGLSIGGDLHRMKGDEAYDALAHLDVLNSETVISIIDGLADDHEFADETFSDAQEAFVKGIQAGKWLSRNGRT